MNVTKAMAERCRERYYEIDHEDATEDFRIVLQEFVNDHHLASTGAEPGGPNSVARVAAGEHLVLMFDPPASRRALEEMRADLRETWPDLADRILLVNGVKTVAVIEKGEPE